MTSPTFCPAKWAEIYIDLHNNWVQGCCKTKPLSFNNLPVADVLAESRQNLLDGVQDLGCSYCWDVENTGGTSLRKQMLGQYPVTVINSAPEFLSLSIKNVCNFACSYCTPKFSSTWVAEVKRGSFKQFTIEPHYDYLAKPDKFDDETILKVFRDNMPTKQLAIVGGEPLMNNVVGRILDQIVAPNLTISFATNMCPESNTVLNKLIAKVKNKEVAGVTLIVSLDATKDIAEFVRDGLNFDKLLSNIDSAIQAGIGIHFTSVLSNITVFDIYNMAKFVLAMRSKYGEQIGWMMNYVVNPSNQTFNCLNDYYKQHVNAEFIKALMLPLKGKEIAMLHTMRAKVNNSTYDDSMYKSTVDFFAEFIAVRNKDTSRLPTIVRDYLRP